MSFEYDPNKAHLGHQRGRVARTTAPGGQPRLRTPRARPCPLCGARPGESCLRQKSGSYEKSMRGYHAERRAAS